MPTPLPIEPHIPEILSAPSRNLVITATPGSGKTTRVPTALARDAGRRVLCIEPRRIACIAAALRVADETGTRPGEFSGYHVRLEKKCTDRTPLRFVTTGMLMQYLIADPFLEDVDAVILDEFHERSIDADVCLGMLRELQRSVREDLRIVVMSATLETASLAEFLGDCTVIDIDAPIYPLEIRYIGRNPGSRFGDYRDALMDALDAAAAERPGDILVFQSGVGEIQQAIAAAEPRFSPRFACVACHASLPLDEQKRILRTDAETRRIIFSTNVAESSLTVPGIRTVIDTGFAKRKFFDSTSGMSRLETVRISRASADQRAGRAARLGPGLCIRLWTDALQNQLDPQAVPEIERLDLTQAWLQIASWPVAPSPESLALLSTPAPGRMADARALLIRLGATDGTELTPLGRQMARLPVEPRLARWLIAAAERGCLRDVSLLAAYLSEAPYRRSQRDAWPGPDLYADFCELKKKLRAPENAYLRRVADDILDAAREIDARNPAPESDAARHEAIARSMLAAYPDRLAKPRPQKEKLPEHDPRRLTQPIHALMSGNRGVTVREARSLCDAKFFLCADLDLVKGVERASSTVVKALEIDPRWIPWEEGVTARYEPDKDRVVIAQSVHFDIFTLRETFLHDPSYRKLERETLLAAARRTPDRVLNLSSDAWQHFTSRLAFVRKVAPELDIPTFDQAWAESLLPDLVAHATCFADIHATDLTPIARRQIDPYIAARIRELAPERVTLQNGLETDVDYTADPPVIRVKIQKAFGTHCLPRVGGGRVPVMIHLCAPNGRPAQVTQDIESFWTNTYADVRKLLRGRYPKHDWPEKPPA